MIATGLLWYDDDTRRPIAVKIAEAADRYRERVGYEPTTCEVNPKQTADALAATQPPARRARKSAALPRVTLHVEPNEHLKPNYILVGVAEGETPHLVRGWTDPAAEEPERLPSRRMRARTATEVPIATVTPVRRARATASSATATPAVMAPATPTGPTHKPSAATHPVRKSTRRTSTAGDAAQIATTPLPGGAPAASSAPGKGRRTKQSTPAATLPSTGEVTTATASASTTHRSRGSAASTQPKTRAMSAKTRSATKQPEAKRSEISPAPAAVAILAPVRGVNTGTKPAKQRAVARAANVDAKPVKRQTRANLTPSSAPAVAATTPAKKQTAVKTAKPVTPPAAAEASKRITHQAPARTPKRAKTTKGQPVTEAAVKAPAKKTAGEKPNPRKVGSAAATSPAKRPAAAVSRTRRVSAVAGTTKKQAATTPAPAVTRNGTTTPSRRIRKATAASATPVPAEASRALAPARTPRRMKTQPKDTARATAPIPMAAIPASSPATRRARAAKNTRAAQSTVQAGLWDTAVAPASHTSSPRRKRSA